MGDQRDFAAFLRRLRKLALVLVAIVALGTAGLVLTEDVSLWRGFIWTLDILATDRQARAVTAQFVLKFGTTGQKTGTTTVRGRLFLTRKRGAWRIFGYDVAKGAR